MTGFLGFEDLKANSLAFTLGGCKRKMKETAMSGDMQVLSG